VSDIWYFADQQGQVGPLGLQELKDALATVSDARDVLVWRDGFSDWKKAGDVPELRAQTVRPPPLPSRLGSAKSKSTGIPEHGVPTSTSSIGSVGEPLGPTRAVTQMGTNHNERPAWQVKWWWYIVALFFLGSVGSRVGRAEMGWISERRRVVRGTLPTQRSSNIRIWVFWGMMLGAALAISHALPWDGDAIRINIIDIVVQTLGFGAFGALCAGIRNWAGRGLP
jgi:hypothetical protein